MHRDLFALLVPPLVTSDGGRGLAWLRASSASTTCSGTELGLGDTAPSDIALAADLLQGAVDDPDPGPVELARGVAADKPIDPYICFSTASAGIH